MKYSRNLFIILAIMMIAKQSMLMMKKLFTAPSMLKQLKIRHVSGLHFSN